MKMIPLANLAQSFQAVKCCRFKQHYFLGIYPFTSTSHVYHGTAGKPIQQQWFDWSCWINKVNFHSQGNSKSSSSWSWSSTRNNSKNGNNSNGRRSSRSKHQHRHRPTFMLPAILLHLNAWKPQFNPHKSLNLRQWQTRHASFHSIQLICCSTSSGIILFLPRLFQKIFKSIYNALRLSFRVVTLAFIFAPVIILFPPWYLLLCPPSTSHLSTLTFWQTSWLHLFINSLEFAGPTFIKLGQWASSRTDVFPNYACEIFSKLQSNVRPHPIKSTYKTIRDSFAVDRFDEMFEYIDPIPIGVGAIAQVHYAKLKPSSADDFSIPVAIKVLHPNVENLVHTDLSILHALATVVECIPGMQWLSPVEEIEAFAGMMSKQLDLRHEATNLHKFIELFEFRMDTSFPEPIRASSHVLVEAFEQGVPMTKFLSCGPTVVDKELASLGLDTFLRMLVKDNFVHADLHPGNIYVTFWKKPSLAARIMTFFRLDHPNKHSNRISPDRLTKLRLASRDTFHKELQSILEDGYYPHLIMLDAGLVSTLSPRNLVNFLDLFHAVANFDGRTAGRLLIERSKTPETVIDKPAFLERFENTLSRIENQTFALSRIKISDILGEALDLIRTHHVRLEGEFVNVVISILLLEGMGRQLDPGLDLLRSAIPVLRESKHTGAAIGGLDKLVLRAMLWNYVGKRFVKLGKEGERVWGVMDVAISKSVVDMNLEDVIQQQGVTQHMIDRDYWVEKVLFGLIEL